jgi:hypothetical protein
VFTLPTLILTIVSANMWLATGWLPTITLDFVGNDPDIDRPYELVFSCLAGFTIRVFGHLGLFKNRRCISPLSALRLVTLTGFHGSVWKSKLLLVVNLFSM